MQEKIRLDAYLVQQNLTTSREKARVLIQVGLVLVNGKRAEKVAQLISARDEVSIVGKEHPYVSRGGLKLEKALRVFPLSVAGKVCADIGASTGGFTDCLLQKGAKKVYALDVGYGQLDWGLRNDARVIVRERCNARYMEPNWFDEALDFACMDVSFISIRRMLVPLISCITPEADVIALIKPQFEAGRENVGKKGVVRDAHVHYQVIADLLSFARQTGYFVCGLDDSPITGPEGNIEFLVWLKTRESKEAWDAAEDQQRIKSVVTTAHERHHTK